MRYGEYKILEMLWNKRIPQHWQTVPLCSIATEKSICNCNELPLLSVYLDNGVVPFEKMGTKRTNATSKDVSKYQRVDPGDFVLNNQQAWRGSVGVSDYTGIVSPAYVILSMDDTLNRRYANYLMRSSFMIDQFYIVSKGVGSIQRNIYWPEFKRSIVPVPPREEQEQIVRYLDWKVSKINKLIHGYQRQIKLLEERKRAQITYMVTHDRFCDERVESEIYWLKDIPVNWHVTRLKHILQKQDRPVLPNAELLICSNSGDVKPRGDNKLGLVADNDDIYQGVAKGDLLIHGMDTWHGAIAISNYDGMCTPVVHVCTSNQSLRFICYYLRMMAFTKVFKAISNGVRQNTSDFRSWDKAGSLLIALPPFREQEAISDILDAEIAKIDIGIATLKRQIGIMEEYRTRLISDVVTGQMDVRGIEVPDYIPEEDIDETVEENKDAEVDTDAESDQ